MKPLTEAEISTRLNSLKGWEIQNKALHKEWVFKDFKEAMIFLNQIADLAESHNHHPEIFNVYNKVTLRFFTHDAAAITGQDFNIAAEIDNL